MAARQDPGAGGGGARAKFLGYGALFSSLGTLLCCALPALLVFFGLGATVASILVSAPWLVALSQHKFVMFMIAGVLIASNFVYVYVVAPRLRATAGACAPGDAACGMVSRYSKIVLWLSAAIYAAGATVAFALGPFLLWWDAHH